MSLIQSLHVIIPFYGDQNLLLQAVESVFQQRNKNWQLTIIDDCSGGKLLSDRLSNFSDSRLKLIQNKSNLGIAINFQKAVDHADADLVTIMGCDDVLLPGYVGKCLELFNLFPSASYFQPGVEVIEQNGKVHFGLTDKVKRMLMHQRDFPSLLKGESLARSLSVGCWTYFPSLCWKTSVLKKYGFRDDFSIVLDMDVQMRIITDGGSLIVDNEPVFQYRRHRASASMAAALDGKRFDEESRLYAELEQAFSKKGWGKAQRAARWRFTSRLNSGLHLVISFFTFKFAYIPKLWRHTFR